MGRNLLIASVVIAISAAAVAQLPRHLRDSKQYKRFHQSVVFNLYNGKADAARKSVMDFLEENPDDIESHFMLGVIEAHAGNQDAAHASLEKALSLGMPKGRILAERNNLLTSLEDIDRYLDNDSLIVHGPMVGHESPSEVWVWVRSATAASYYVQVFDADSGERDVDAITSATATSESTDFTDKAYIKKLKPNHRYRVVATVKSPHAVPTSEIDSPKWRKAEATIETTFTTLPEEDKPAKFTIGFGGGAGYVPQHEHMWNAVGAVDPLVFLFLGDNIYPDAPELTEMQRYSYYRRQSGAVYREFIAHTPLWAVWDDHDFSVNDSWGGPELDVPPWKESVWNVFRQNWVNPAFGGGKNVRGVWFDTSIADVDFFFLDSRYYRTDPEGDNPTQLGPVQRAWLLDGLRESSATFKVICSPVPFVTGTKGGSLDTWDGFPEERQAILDTIKENEIDGVFILAADRHRSDVWRMDIDDAYPIYELESSRLTNQHVHEEQEGSLFSYNEKQSFGKVVFDTAIDDPTVTYTIINIDGEEVHTHTIKLSEISF